MKIGLFNDLSLNFTNNMNDSNFTIKENSMNNTYDLNNTKN